VKITEYSLSKKTVAYFAIAVLILGGLWSYNKLGKLEFPNYTIKTAVVTTTYAGATSEEVEQEVTDRLEKAVQELSQIDEVRSISQPGLSIIYVDIQKTYDSSEIPQIWDELRRKVNDAQVYLPPGAGPSMVNDDFGDVYGVFFAVTGDGYSYEEIKDTVDMLKRELLLVEGVANVEIWGAQQEVIKLRVSRSRMAEFGVGMSEILGTLNRQNLATGSGKVTVNDDYIRINPTGEFTKVEDLGDLLVRSDAKGNLIYLKDLVDITREYQDPASALMRYNGQDAIGLGISTVDGGNVVEMGKAVRERLQELEGDIPLGMEIGVIAYQADLVSNSVKAFVINLMEAVAIVIVALVVTMGLSSGMLMGVILLLTILGTFIGMKLMSIDFQMVSLGALILALGMLVDNAIVVTEGILVRVQQGEKRTAAAIKTVAQTAWPLLGATIVAVLAFAAIGTSPDATGEFLISLFLVMAISLGLSWVLAITITPLFCVQFLPKPKEGKTKDPYGGFIFRTYRRILDMSLHHRFVSVLVLIAIWAASVYGFKYVDRSFFPNDSRNQFKINFWRPEGTHIEKVSEDIRKFEAFLAQQEEVEATTSFIGRGALRFVLTYEPQMPNSSYAQILVTVKDFRTIDNLIERGRTFAGDNFADAQVIFEKFKRGSSTGSQLEARFSGEDIEVLRELSQKARQIMLQDTDAVDIKDNWRQPVMTLRPQVSEATARRLGITRPQIAEALSMNFSGKTFGVFREENKLLPMILQAPEAERESVEKINDIVVFSPATGSAVPLSKIVTGMETRWEDPIIRRRDRHRTITVECNPVDGNATTLFERLRPQIEAMELPQGYSLEWGGDYEHSGEAKEGLFKMVPVFFLAMIFIVVMLFNAVRKTLIIFLCLPLISIGVTAALLLTGEPFGFMCILGYLGLSGMIIKNAVVLIDQINLEIDSGKQPYPAILDSAVSRLRPVTMAALTTVLGMIPLLTDVFFSGMSITIIGGLTFGTILTLVVVPVLYSLFYRIGRTA
jgi:multidrug efflux pump subunit AcrB